ncbi:BTAD domain-containing putative transcriptional regulator [Microbacterium sp. B2969]|uniref:BTAD domain-containing putative transcriptional regulator n=1 Tax=Microbacterium alkaliflavum TaxID=3248839 RepID=A0ABW7Q5Z0_9MICO
MVVKVLGPLETGTDPLSPRERTVLSALIVRAGSTIAPAELAEAWWGETPPRTWEQQIRNSIARIRARLGRTSIETLGWEYRLGLDPDAIDAVRFERLVSTARGHALRGEQDRAVDAYGRALALWRGAPLQDVTRWEPGVVEAMRLNEIRASAEEELLDARLAAGEHRSVIADAERLLREEPLREDRWAIVALANYRANRQAEGLAVVRRARERLADELGIEPGPRLAELELAMLRRDPALDAPIPLPPTIGVCPYPGLRPFGPDDAEVFFGRDGDIEILLDRVAPGAIVTIAGASGTGKSSLLLAGLVPRLRARGGVVEVIRPSVDGAAALGRAVERAHLVAVDQAEELLRIEDSAAFAEVARTFLDGGGTILLTARSDALDALRALPEIGDEIGRGVYLLGGLTDAAYRSAIEQPARQAGLALEPGLVEVAVRDAGDRSSTLPHLSHAMQETWSRREGATLTVEGYRLSGGIPGAIAQSAEEAFRVLSPEDQAICRSLLLRLVDRGADGISTRRRVPADPLLADPRRRRVLEGLVRGRLVTLDGDAVVVAHEAVATAWPRLDAWLEEDADGARTLRSIEGAAATWEAGEHDDDDLLRGARLHSALTWRDAADPDLTAVERAYLVASDLHSQGVLRELSERAAHEKRRNRVLRGALAVAGLLLVAAVVAGSLAVVRGQDAAAAAKDAQIEAVTATSLSLRENDRDAAALLAAEAYRRWPGDARVRSALLGTITSANGLLDTHRTKGADRTITRMIPGTTRALRVRDGAAGSALEIVETATGDVVRKLDVELDVPDRWFANSRDVDVSGDGRVAVIQSPVSVDPDDPTCCWNQLTFVDLVAGTELPGSQLLKIRTSTHIDLGGDGSVAYLVHPITGDLIAVGTRTGDVRTSSPAAFDDFSGQGGLYNGVAVLDDRLVAAAVADRVDIFDRQTLALVRSIALSARYADNWLLADAAGGLIASGRDGLAKVTPATGAVVWERPVSFSDVCFNLALTHSGVLVCSGLDTVAVLDPATGLRTGRAVHTQFDDSYRIGVIDDDTILIDAGSSASWMRWRLDGSGAAIQPIARGRAIVDPPSADGRFINTVPIDDGPAQLWTLGTDSPTGIEADGMALLSTATVDFYHEDQGVEGLQTIATGTQHPYRIPGLPHDFALTDGGWGPDAFASFDGKSVAFDPSTGRQVGATLAVPDSPFDYVQSISESMDGRLVVIDWLDFGLGKSQSALFRLSDGKMLAQGLPDRDRVVITPSGAIIAAGGESVERVDPKTFEPSSTLAQADGGSQLLMASLDEKTLLNVGYDNRLRLYDLTADIPLGDTIDGDTPQGWPGGFLTADGKTLLTNSPNGVLAWDLRPDAEARAACALAGREFSAAEWSTYFPGEPQVATCDELGS